MQPVGWTDEEQGQRADMRFHKPAFQAQKPFYKASPSLANLATERLVQRAILFSDMSYDRARQIWLRICIALFIITGFYGLALGGHIHRFGSEIGTTVDQVARTIGFRIEAVKITGQERIDPKVVIAALKIDQISLLSFNTQTARNTVEALPWVKTAHIFKLFPSTIKVKIEERVPYAIWQHKGKHYWIDTDGVKITEIEVSNRPDLPLIVGKGAATAAHQLFAELKDNPELKRRMSVAFRVAERRWTLKLKNGVEIWLPEQKIGAAFREIIRLEEKYQILSGRVTRIDLRLPDRVTIRKA